MVNGVRTQRKGLLRLRMWFDIPPHDWLILPAIFVLTPILLLCIAETLIYYPLYEKLGDSCLVADPLVGHRAKPNCVSRYKVADSPWIENHYNDCGYRTTEPCGPKPAGTIRVAVIGSSISAGYMVLYQQMFSTQAAAALTRDCRRPVQFQDLGGVGYQWDRLYQRMQEALTLKPDLLVMTITPFDLMVETAEDPQPVPRRDGLLETIKNTVRDRIKETAIWRGLSYLQSANRQFYVRLYLQGTDNSGYLRTPLPASWQDRLDRLDQLLGRMSQTAHAASVPFVLIYIPPRPQVLLLDHAVSFPGLAPASIEDLIAAEAAKAGLHYIDTARTFAKVTDPDSVFFALSDHPNSLGHKIIADELVSDLITEKIPAFAGCTTTGS